MTPYIVGALMFSLAPSMPDGWVKVNPELCKRAYGMNVDGYLIGEGGQRRIVRGYCYKRI